MLLRLILATVAAALTVSNVCHAEDQLAAHYFGHIEAACKDSGDQCLQALLHRIDTECTQIEDSHGCKAGTELLQKIFGETYRPGLPDYIVYLQQKDEAGKTYFYAHTPVLIWHGKNTPYLYGARDIHAIVITEKKVCLSASVHTDYRIDPNPFVAIASALGAKFDTREPKPSEDNTAQFHWYPLSGRETTPLWLAIGRIPVDVNSVNRITVQYKQPTKPSGTTDGTAKSDKALPSGSSGSASSGSGSSRSGSSGADKGPSGVGKGSSEGDTGDQPIECTNTDRVVVSETHETREKTSEKDKTLSEKMAKTETTEKVTTHEKVTTQDNLQYSGDFLAANGFFSDSPDDYFAVSFALGLTVPASDTSIASGGSNLAVNGYLLAKVYIKQPTLRASPKTYLRGYEPSIGVFLGSNVSNHAFNELVAGVSIGNLLGGRAGILLGANSIAAAAMSSAGRKIRPFVGVEYTF